MGTKAKGRRTALTKKNEENSVIELVGKTIASAMYEKAAEGYGNLTLTFTDGTTASVCYSCMGGVWVDRPKP